MKNKLIVHGLGGAGITVSKTIIEPLSQLGEGFADIDIHYIDTSDSNRNTLGDNTDNLWVVKSKSHSNRELSGSGSERSTNVTVIQDSIPQYLDYYQYTEPKNNEFHIVVTSISGASGSTALYFLVKNLLERKIPLILILIGDSSNSIYCKNTLKSLASLYNLADETQEAISICYVNNNIIADSDDILEKIKRVNEVIRNMVYMLSLFLSGENEGIDSQDMINFIHPSRYKSINVKPGLYGLGFYSNNVSIPNSAIPIIGRTLTLKDASADTKLTLLHHKHGYVYIENVFKTIKKEDLPMHVVLLANFLETEEQHLQDTIATFDKLEASIKTNTKKNISSLSDGNSGLVL